MSSNIYGVDEIITINVGGRHFTTFKVSCVIGWFEGIIEISRV